MVSDEHPLGESIRRAADLSELFNISIRDISQDGWLGAGQLFQDNGERLGDLVMALGVAWRGTENRHVAGSAFIIAYLTKVTWPLIAQYVLERKVPDVRLTNLEFHWTDEMLSDTAMSNPYFAVLPGIPLPIIQIPLLRLTRRSFMDG